MKERCTSVESLYFPLQEAPLRELGGMKRSEPRVDVFQGAGNQVPGDNHFRVINLPNGYLGYDTKLNDNCVSLTHLSVHIVSEKAILKGVDLLWV